MKNVSIKCKSLTKKKKKENLTGHITSTQHADKSHSNINSTE